MRDEDFNRMFGDGDPPDPIAWLILAGGVIVVVLLAYLYAALQ